MLEKTKLNSRLFRDLLTVGQFAGHNYFFQGEMVLMLAGLINAIGASTKYAKSSTDPAEAKLGPDR
jgi:hypothetical protein